MGVWKNIKLNETLYTPDQLGVAEVKYESDSRRVLVSPLQPANTNIIVKETITF